MPEEKKQEIKFLNMTFTEIAKAALDLGVIPALLLLLVFAMYRQNQRLIADRQKMEQELLRQLMSVFSDYRALVSKIYEKRSK